MAGSLSVPLWLFLKLCCSWISYLFISVADKHSHTLPIWRRWKERLDLYLYVIFIDFYFLPVTPMILPSPSDYIKILYINVVATYVYIIWMNIFDVVVSLSCFVKCLYNIFTTYIPVQSIFFPLLLIWRCHQFDLQPRERQTNIRTVRRVYIYSQWYDVSDALLCTPRLFISSIKLQQQLEKREWHTENRVFFFDRKKEYLNRESYWLVCEILARIFSIFSFHFCWHSYAFVARTLPKAPRPNCCFTYSDTFDYHFLGFQ